MRTVMLRRGCCVVRRVCHASCLWVTPASSGNCSVRTYFESWLEEVDLANNEPAGKVRLDHDSTVVAKTAEAVTSVPFPGRRVPWEREGGEGLKGRESNNPYHRLCQVFVWPYAISASHLHNVGCASVFPWFNPSRRFLLHCSSLHLLTLS